MFKCSENFTSGGVVQSFRLQMNVSSRPVSNLMGCDINRLGSCRKWNNFISTFTSLNVFSGFFLFVYWKVFLKKYFSNLFHVLHF